MNVMSGHCQLQVTACFRLYPVLLISVAELKRPDCFLLENGANGPETCRVDMVQWLESRLELACFRAQRLQTESMASNWLATAAAAPSTQHVFIMSANISQPEPRAAVAPSCHQRCGTESLSDRGELEQQLVKLSPSINPFQIAAMTWDSSDTGQNSGQLASDKRDYL
ncbi:hypothetical protein GE09DRAFT_1090796 [Coniochaeta sp. 2T2.1]|nr:hypothetical protein GE09DRAFT_1090796 [Coniochaeta sp. 2T2.1]